MTKAARVRVPTAWEWLQAGKTGSALDPAAEAAFFSAIRLSNGTFKTTCHRRLDDFNQIISAALRRTSAARNGPLQLLDVGISSGTTSLEWARALESQGLDFRLVATDLTATASLHRYGKWFHALVDDHGTPLQYHIFGKTIRGWFYPGDVLRLKFVPIRLAQLSHLLLQKAGLGAIDEVPLVVSGVLMNPAIEVCSDDIFCDDPTYHGRFHVIRAANILNRVYFSEDKLAVGVTNLSRRLREGGILAVCRTMSDGSNHGSLLQLTRGRLAKIEQFGNGSDVDYMCEPQLTRGAA